MAEIPGIILAGGLATRMGGGDKGLLPLGNSTVMSHVINRLAPQVSALAINANGDPARFSDFGLPVLSDPISGHPGPLAGVLAGLDWAASHGATKIATAAADTPFLPLDLVDRLIEITADMANPLALAATDRNAAEMYKSETKSGLVRHPTFGIWPVSLRNDLRDNLCSGLRKVVLWTDRHGAREARFDMAINPFFNINTPEDLLRARGMLEDAE
ncbi:MAG: molybdenum cofactor guanylyltransferase MobA [Roseovarius sp.]|nr:molybdenum cofactor guanylyltransferase MobA [Roseovarius sp.]